MVENEFVFNNHESLPIQNNLPDESVRKALRGSPSIIFRQFLTAIVAVLSGVILARLLTPSEFGIYGLLLITLAFLRVVTDGGLGSALVRQQKAPDTAEYKQIFSAQTLSACVLFLFLLVMYFSLPEDLYAVPGWKVAILITSSGLLFAPITSNAVAFLERSMDYSRLGLITLVQPLFFGVVSVLLVVMGFGIIGIGISALTSFIISALISRLVHAPIGFTLKTTGLPKMLTFGIPFAASQMVSTVKDSVIPLFLGITFGATAAGILTWAQQFAILATIFVMSFSRYLFPLFARLIEFPRKISETVTSVLILFNCSVAPLSLAIVLWPIDLTTIFYGEHWIPGVQVLIFLSIANFFSPTYSVLLSVVNAMGKPGTGFYLALVSLVGTWVLVPLFSISAHLGMEGYGLANIILQLPGLMLLWVSRKKIKINYFKSWLLPWVICVPILLITRLIFQNIFISSEWTLMFITLGIVAVLVAYSICFKLEIRNIKELLKPNERPPN